VFVVDRYVALFDGQPIFGPVGTVSTANFSPTVAEVDAFLGLIPGTTQYADTPMYAVTGTLTGPDLLAVEAVQWRLLSFASSGPVPRTAPFSRDNGLPWPGGYEVDPSCYFLPHELVFNPAGISGPVAGVYSVSYSLVIRRVNAD
jgi:hypothetical protein